MNLLQPYVQKNAKEYQSMRGSGEHIFEYYAFEEEPTAQPINAVPDGCVDLLYAIGKDDVRCFLGGTVLKMKYWPFEKNRTYFGIRFLPGQCILPKGISIGDIINTDLEIPSDAYGAKIDEALLQAKSMRERASIIHKTLAEAGQKHTPTDAKGNIEAYIRNRIYETKGNVSIKEIAQDTGYSECYVRRTFHEMHGISPKTFEKIVRFQNTLEEMALHKDEAFYDMAQESGYYDQSHMVKEFKNFTGLTPEKYMKHMMNVE